MKLYRKITILLCGIPFFGMAQQSGFKLEGRITSGATPAKVLLYYSADGQSYLDSCEVKGGKYKFDGLVSSPERADIYAKYPNQPTNMQNDIISFFLEPGTIKITNNGNVFSQATVEGSPASNDFFKLKPLVKPYEDKVNSLVAKSKQLEANKDTASADKLRADIKATTDDMRKNVYGNFVKNNPNSPIAMYALQQYAGGVMNDPKSVEALYNLLPATTTSTKEATRFHQLIQLNKISLPGNVAPDFVQNDPNGNPVALSSYRGKYLLVYFWSSICGPCRALNPKLVKVYQQFQPKGFDILGVSLDRATANGSGKAAWIRAINHDKLPWMQVSDLQFWNNAAARKFGITAMPMNVLIDPKGVIVARNLEIPELQTTLSQIYNH